jgi:hypothetical protein
MMVISYLRRKRETSKEGVNHEEDITNWERCQG